MKLTNAPPRPERPPIKINWLLWIGVLLIAALLSGGVFVYQTVSQRRELGALIVDLSKLDRAALTNRWIVRNHGFFYRKKEWAQKVDWTPAPSGEKPTDRRARGLEEQPPLPRVTTAGKAPLALAVTPREDYLDFDAIYLLYDGDRVVSSFSLSLVGGFFDGEMLDQRKNPKTLIARPLTAEERDRLKQMIALLEQRRDGFNEQSDKFGWTQNVINNARKLLEGSQP